MKGPPYLLSRLPALSEDHDVLLLLKPLSEGDRIGLSSSRNRRVLLLRGGSNSSADSAGAAEEYKEFPLTAFRNDCAVPDRPGCVSDRDEGCRVARCGRESAPTSVLIWRMSPAPEFSLICGGLCLSMADGVRAAGPGLCKSDLH